MIEAMYLRSALPHTGWTEIPCAMVSALRSGIEPGS